MRFFKILVATALLLDGAMFLQQKHTETNTNAQTAVGLVLDGSDIPQTSPSR